MNLLSKKIVALVLSIVIISSVTTGCSSLNSAAPGNAPDKINIVCTIFPQYDWVMNLIKTKSDKFNVTLLVSNGVDLHSYQPSAKDIATISGCDLFIYVGGESDSWVDDVIKQANNPDLHTINMMEILKDKTYVEEVVEGMQGEDEHDDSKEDNDSEEPEYDEHVWLSLRNASIICHQITAELSLLDPEDSTDYSRFYSDYSSLLTGLDASFNMAVSHGTTNTVLFADRFPFRYLVEDYNIDYYAAFPGCSAETEASFETIVFLSDKMKELGLTSVCVTESSDNSIANTVIDNTKGSSASIVEFNSMQSVSLDDIKAGANYFDIMNDNLNSFKKALGVTE